MERRTFLVLGAAAVGLAGCTRGSSEPSPPSPPPSMTPPTDPDARLRDEVAASEVALIAAYRSAIAADPGLAADLEPFLAHHEQHLARVAPTFEAASGSPAASGSDPGAATPPGSAPPSPSTSGSDPGAATPPGSAPPSPSASPALPSASASPAKSDAPNGSEGPSPSGGPLPSSGSTLAALAEAESAARGQRATACNGAQDPGLARDLCLIAASEAQHAVVLGRLAAKESES